MNKYITKFEKQKKAHYAKRRLIFLVCVFALLMIVSISCFSGVADVTPQRLIATLINNPELAEPLSAKELTVLFHLRMPRIVLALLAGVGLAISGTVMQVITGNSMASPFTTGISNAAAMGASTVIVFSLNFLGSIYLTTVGVAFLCAVLCAVIVYGIAATKNLGSTAIVLLGIALNYFFSALNAAMQYLANEQQLSSIVNWTFGSFNGASWEQIVFTSVILLLTLPYIFWQRLNYNILTTGDESAKALGVPVTNLRTISGIVITLISATVVSFCGVIGFVGIVAPHIAKLLIGGDYRALIPLSALLGGLLLVSADLLGRTIASPVIVPVGIVVSFIGVPIFIYLILKDKKESVQ